MSSVVFNGTSFVLPLIIIAIGGIYSERSGVNNLALEGFAGFGAFSGGLVVVLLSGASANPPAWMFWLSFVGAALGGALFSLLHALLCLRFKANHILSGVALNVIALALVGLLIEQVNLDLYHTFSNFFQLPEAARLTLPNLSSVPLVGMLFANAYAYAPVITLLVLLAWYVLNHTSFGLRLRACGDNPEAVAATGVDVVRVRYQAVAISGALAGFGGLCFAYSQHGRISTTIFMGFGYLAIAGMVLGNWRILPTIGACAVFGFARSVVQHLALRYGIEYSMLDLAMAVPYALVLLLIVYGYRSSTPPKALGKHYEKNRL
ncbi:MAG: ABC transporter permease [Coriobacteriales bacterium]|jgi:simple sugar transport system permease protein|nr:ABC transporter permease [Coriobacteriales bacterium]